MNPIQIINLLNVPRIGPQRVKKILAHLNQDQNPFEASIKNLRAIKGIDARAPTLAVLGQDPVHIDELAHSVDMDITSLLEILLKPELKNAVQQIGGKQFVRA